MAILDEVREAVQQVAARVGPAVVGIGGRRGLGTGVVISDGTILTNAHNLRGEETEVTFADGRTVRASVAGVDPDGDLAVLSAATGDATPVEWPPDGEAIEIGSTVLALSNPGGRGLRVTMGIVSATERAFRGPRGRRIAGTIEHTAPLPRGSSGGPVVDAEGRLLGINTNRAGDGFYLAIPADQALRERIQGLSRGEARHAPRLGVGVAPSFVARRLRGAVGLPDRDGVLVRAVEDGSAAQAAGIEPGDLIVEAGGRTVGGADDLYQALDELGDGDSLPLRVVRGAEERSVSVSFGESPTVREEA